MKQSEHLAANNRGMTPVIGVVLMAAIAIVLTAIMGGFFVEIGAETEDMTPIPSVDFEVEYDGSVAVITHQGGDNIDQGERLVIQSEEDGEETTIDGLSAGESVEVDIDEDGDTVNIIWEADRGDTTSEILESTEVEPTS